MQAERITYIVAGDVRRHLAEPMWPHWLRNYQGHVPAQLRYERPEGGYVVRVFGHTAITVPEVFTREAAALRCIGGECRPEWNWRRTDCPLHGEKARAEVDEHGGVGEPHVDNEGYDVHDAGGPMEERR